MDQAFVTTDTLALRFQEAVGRIVAMEKLVVPNAVTAVPYIAYVQDTFPYWTNGMGRTPAPDGPDDATRYDLTVTMRLVIGHLTAGYEGENQEAAWVIAPTVLRYFRRYRFLQLPGQARILHLAPTGCTISSPRGLVFAVIKETTQLALEFELIVPFNISKDD